MASPRPPSDPPPFLRVLGPPRLHAGAEDGTPPLLGPGKPLALLARLVSRPEGLTREALAAFLWPEMPEARARASLRQTLHSLRLILGQDAFEASRHLVRLAGPPASDLAAFLDAVAAGDDAAAAAAYGGPFLDGLALPDAAEAAQWIAVERLRLERLFGEAARGAVRAALARGEPLAALTVAERLRDGAPDAPGAWAPLLDVLDHAGERRRLAGELAALRARLEAGTLEEPAAARTLLARFDGAPEPAPVASAAWQPRFVAREMELARLHSAWAAVQQGRGARFLVSGPAGVGKSRLLEEFLRRPRAERAHVVRVRGRRVERDDAYAFLGDLVQALTALPGSVGIMEASATALVELVPALARQFPGTAWRQDTGGRDRRLMLALADLLTTLADERPVVLVLDDLHWADGASLAVVDRALARLAGVAVLALGAARPRPLPQLDGWEVLEPGLLSPAKLHLMLGGDDAAPPAWLLASLHEVSGGLPLQVLQAIQLVMERDQLRLVDGRWEVPDPAALRATLAAADLLEARLAAQSGRALRVLAGLGLADVPLTPDDLRFAEGDAGALRACLADLEAAGFVVPGAGGTWTIGHDMLADVVLHRVPPALRRATALELAGLLAERAVTVADIRRAVRLFLEADAVEPMLDAARAWRRRTPAGPRGTALAAMLLGPQAAPELRRRLARAVPARATGTAPAVIAVAVMALLSTLALTTWLRHPARLVLTNRPVFSLGGQMGVPPMLEVHNWLGKRSTALDGATVTARLLEGADSLTGVSATRVADGQVSLDSMRAWTGDGRAHVSRPLRVAFVVEDLPPLEVELRPAIEHATMRLESGVLAGQVLDPDRPVVRIAPGDSVNGWLRVRYTSPYVGILIMLAQFTTFGEPRGDTTSIASLLTPARNAWLQHEVRHAGPTAPGEYWLVWTFGPEAAAVWLASATNWQCQVPEWDDGNELARLPDSMFTAAWGGGELRVRHLYCPVDAGRLYQFDERPAVAVKVVVR